MKRPKTEDEDCSSTPSTFWQKKNEIPKINLHSVLHTSKYLANN